ncbi:MULTISPECIES: SHOCT domain-containing protein [Acetobacterium]|uniref:SHOCT-like domain-containing protein n=1 Tax=Acetobacterium wieringae TaxID=52694 RepID=A0A1F2PES2_9FIRM|nr:MULTISPECIES: SHOCT domain-containing protein [Acetobacterium]OFV69166.1 hypothetical protein ACWI_33600 [Acetobacterium wieringae]
MTKDQLEQEKNYRISVILSKELMSKGLITKEEFDRLDTMLLEKYQPIISSL